MKRLSLILICVTIAAMSAMADDIIKVCGQNVQNFFYSLDRNRTTDNNIPVSNYNTVEGRTAKLNAIISALAPYEADIYTFNEVECCEEVMTLLAESMSAATVMPIANPCSVTDYSKAYSDHNPYMVTLSLGNNGHTAPQYVRAKTVTAGNKYAMVGTLNGGLEAALALAANYTYGYLKTQTVTEEAGVIETVPSSMLFEFADAGDGLFYIKDCNGRYIYSDKRDNGTYYSTFSMTPDVGAAHTFTVTPEADGTFKIQNTTNDYFIQATIYEGAGEFGLWNYQGTDRYLPFLYEELKTTGITTINHEPLTTDHYYNLAGQRITRPTKGIYILNGKKIFFK